MAIPEAVPHKLLTRLGPAVRRSLAAQGARSRSDRVVAGSVLILLLPLAVLPASRWVGPEPHWWATVLHYLPGWFWLIPVGGVALLCLIWARRWLWLPILVALYVGGPWMGFNVPLPIRGGESGGTSLRVMTYNTHGLSNGEIRSEIRRADPDILIAQEFAMDAGWERDLPEHTHRANTYGASMLSRYPITRFEERELPNAGGRRYLRAEVQIGQRLIAVYSIHLDTPRWAFEALIGGKWAGIPKAEQLTAGRVQQAEHLASEIGDETIPVVVGGDFNAPSPSRVMQAFFRQGLRDAHEEAGWGWGYTQGHSLRWGTSHVRIDHLLVSRGLAVTDCRVGESTASDHRAVIADLRLR